MPKLCVLIAAAALLVAAPALAADYKCANIDTRTRLNDYDIEIKQREGVVEEIKGEIKDSGGTTEQHKQALQSFEDKLEQVKKARAELIKECPAKTEP